VVLVGDRGMLTQPQIDKMKLHPGLGWITALTSVALRGLLATGALQLSLLDETNLAEITSPDYPGERLMVCHNPLLEEERGRKRQRVTASHGESTGQSQQASRAAQEEAPDGSRDCAEGGQGAGASQGWASTFCTPSARVSCNGRAANRRLSRRRS
jgi:hypothetical protein